LLLAERALCPNAAAPIIFFERHRQQARLGEDFHQKGATFMCLADLWLIQVRAETGQKAPLGWGAEGVDCGTRLCANS
jgi:hypothetical protein